MMRFFEQTQRITMETLFQYLLVELLWLLVLGVMIIKEERPEFIGLVLLRGASLGKI